MTYFLILLYAYGALAATYHMANEVGIDVDELSRFEIYATAFLVLFFWPAILAAYKYG
jgi:hypothetical protein